MPVHTYSGYTVDGHEYLLVDFVEENQETTLIGLYQDESVVPHVSIDDVERFFSDCRKFLAEDCHHGTIVDIPQGYPPRLVSNEEFEKKKRKR